MIVIPPSKQAGAAGKTGSQFTGDVFAYLTMPSTDGVTINTVNFTPCARTYWHHHENGQILIVLAGSRAISSRMAARSGSCARGTRYECASGRGGTGTGPQRDPLSPTLPFRWA